MSKYHGSKWMMLTSSTCSGLRVVATHVNGIGMYGGNLNTHVQYNYVCDDCLFTI